MGRRETHGKYNKKRAPKSEAPAGSYVRTLSLEDLARDVRSQRAQTIELTVRGFLRGAVTMTAEDGGVFYCEKEHVRGALFGDRVLCELRGQERVSVIRVLQRAHEHIIGVLREGRRGLYIVPLERHLPPEIAIAHGRGGAAIGDIVRALVIRWEDEGGLLAQVEDRLGSFDQATDALSALVAGHHLREAFAPEALAQAERCREADLADDPSREDLRALLTFTIDGRDAKDFDDAVSLERLGDGLRLGVHIADVGHYVPQGSALDREAFLRGTSVYLPGRVLPMLPEQLSNGVCSLRPHEDKFTLSALMEMNAQGEVQHVRVVRSITRSKARLVYDEVNALFAGGQAQREQYDAMHPALVQTLQDMRALAEAIRRRRAQSGAIDFETPEPTFILDEQGEPVEIILRARGEAEMLIEDFMLTANEAVARLAREKRLPLLYRVHEQPDPEKLAAFISFLTVIGVDARRITSRPAPGEIRALLEATRDRSEYGVITTLALRSMQKARYDAQPLGHYGLAMADYCHFTSPIRRYPDLVVSRALTAMLTGARAPMIGDRLEEAALRSSDCERAAVEAERAADKLMMARMMAAHVGEIYEGTVSGVSDWGVYVMLSNGAEGFIHVRSMEDWFVFDERRMTLRGERTGACFTLGQSLSVRVANVELTTSAIDLHLAAPIRPAPKREKSEKKRERARIRGFYK